MATRGREQPGSVGYAQGRRVRPWANGRVVGYVLRYVVAVHAARLSAQRRHAVTPDWRLPVAPEWLT